MSDSENDSSINENINESFEVNDGEPTKSLQKPKKPRTEKQIEALKKAQEKRAENIEKRKQEKEENKKLNKKEKLKKELEELEDGVMINEDELKCNKVGKEINPSNNGFGEDIDTEALIKKHEAVLRKLALSKVNACGQTAQKPKKKKPVKQTIVYESESSETEEEEIIIKKKPRKQKKKPKKKIVYESSSESESEEDEIEEPPAPRQRLRYNDVFRFQ
jgi:hypothetical protein